MKKPVKKAQNGVTREKVSTISSNLKPGKVIPQRRKGDNFSRVTLNSPLPSSADILRKKASAKNGKSMKKSKTVNKAFLGSLLGGAGGGGLLGGLLGGGGGGGMLGGLLGGGGGKGGAEGGGMGKISKMFSGSMKKGGKVTKKAKTGTSLGMKSVKAGYDKNPGVTRADIITAATKKAKTGTSVPKKNSVSKNIGNLNKAKSGTSMKKCRYGCK